MLKSTRVDYQGDLEHLTTTLDDLDELGEIMTEMLQTQDSVEVYPDMSLHVEYRS